MRIVCGLFLACAVASCKPGAQASSDSSTGAGGKADDVAVIRTPASEPLGAKALKRLICDQIGAEFAGQACYSKLAFTITEFATSTLYAHQDELDPVTMQLEVEAVQASTGKTYFAVLTRAVDADLTLSFVAKVSTDGDATHAVIAQLADEAGEFPDWAVELADRVDPVAKAELPKAIRDLFDAQLAARIDELNPDGGNTNSAAFGDDFPFLEIVDDGGVVIGYVLGVYDSIDDPLWDGSGVHYYYDVDGELVTTVEWTG